ncbi:MAG: hypothetical protein OXI81_14185 [Paracoccaceae bacterium]|nr:hypothetical protein [Paracoccaceae bacterium]MDE2914722.1 hypothetical protein [Paracoccaceae bacterium]
MPYVTEAELDRRLAWITGAPSEAPIDVLCHRPGFSERSFPDSISVSVAGGIDGERWLEHPWMKLADGSPDPRIQVSILSKRLVDIVWTDRENTIHPGDTIIADINLSEENFPAGTRISVGSAVLEVSDLFNNACAKWKVRYGPESYKWVNRPEYRHLRLRGALCKVVKDGIIRADDVLRRV